MPFDLGNLRTYFLSPLHHNTMLFLKQHPWTQYRSRGVSFENFRRNSSKRHLSFEIMPCQNLMATQIPSKLAITHFKGTVDVFEFLLLRDIQFLTASLHTIEIDLVEAETFAVSVDGLSDDDDEDLDAIQLLLRSLLTYKTFLRNKATYYSQSLEIITLLHPSQPGAEKWVTTCHDHSDMLNTINILGEICGSTLTSLTHPFRPFDNDACQEEMLQLISEQLPCLVELTLFDRNLAGARKKKNESNGVIAKRHFVRHDSLCKFIVSRFGSDDHSEVYYRHYLF